jgi:hypothetical protein
MTISGGYVDVTFDWLEEGACIDCVPQPQDCGGDLVWHCEECEGGRAEWTAEDS